MQSYFPLESKKWYFGVKKNQQPTTRKNVPHLNFQQQIRGKEVFDVTTILMTQRSPREGCYAQGIHPTTLLYSGLLRVAIIRDIIYPFNVFNHISLHMQTLSKKKKSSPSKGSNVALKAQGIGWIGKPAGKLEGKVGQLA